VSNYWHLPFLLSFLLFTIPAQAQTTLLSESFDSDLGVFSAYSVTSDANWRHVKQNGDGVAYINGFQSNETSNDWLISPALDLSSTSFEELTVNVEKNYEGPDLKVKVSTNYSGSGDPTTASWAEERSIGSSGDVSVDLSDYTGNGSVYVAFHYTSDGITGSTVAEYLVDDVEIISTDKTLVRFASGRTLAAEDAGSVDLTVELYGPSQSSGIDVDVLFNNGNSTAGTGDLSYTTQTISFPSSASSGDSKTVTVDLLDNTSADGNKDAEFELENLSTSGSASLSRPDTTTLTIIDDDRTIDQARTALRNGTKEEEVILEGTVTRAHGAFGRIQDESGPTGASGIAIKQTRGAKSTQFRQDVANGTIQAGTQLRVQGTLSHFRGRIWVEGADLSGYTVMGQGTAPAAQEVTLSELQSNGEDYESELIRVSDLSFSSASGALSNATSYDVTDGTATLRFRVQGSNQTTVGGAPIPPGTFTFNDVLGQFNSGGGITDDTGYQLIPVNSSTALIRPTVQFASNSYTVAEDGVSADLTVKLAGPTPSEGLDVDVQFNADNSTADLGTTYDTKTVSFSSSASSGDTKTVTVGVDDNSNADGNRTGEFVLTNLSTPGSTVLGGPETTTLTIVDDDRTIHQARTALRNGNAEEVILEGTVSRAYRDYVRMQDESGPTGASAILVRQTAGSNSTAFEQDVADGNIKPGTELRVQGKLIHFNGLVEVNNSDLTSYTVMMEDGTPPDAQEITLSDLESNGEDYESELVRITGLSFPSASGTFSNNTSYDVVDGTQSSPFVLRVGTQNQTQLGGVSIPSGSFTFNDVVGQFNGGGGVTDDTGYRLTAIRSSTALPVEFASFRASRVNEKVELTWTTTSETGNVGFDVQHRGPAASSWSSLGFVEGAGTTTEPQNYHYETESLTAGTHTFRLQQTDVDGTTSYSREVPIDIRPEAGVSLTGPNPIAPGQTSKLTVQVNTKQTVEVELYDVLGQRVRMIHSGPLTPADPLQARLDVSGLSSNLYFLRVSGETLSEVRKISVVQ